MINASLNQRFYSLFQVQPVLNPIKENIPSNVFLQLVEIVRFSEINQRSEGEERQHEQETACRESGWEGRFQVQNSLVNESAVPPPYFEEQD